MDQFDHAHLKELVALHDPDFDSANLIPLPSQHISPTTNSIHIFPEFDRKLNLWELDILVPYKKGNQFSKNHSSFFSSSPKCQELREIGTNTIPLCSRVSFYISSFQTLPNHPKYFRPSPLKSYKDIKNPYTQTLAVAYDFLETIHTQTPEYCAFLKKSSPSQPYPTSPIEHIAFLPFWLSFLDYETIIHTGNPNMFKCKTPGCNKQYKQSYGLKYHNTKGKCRLSLGDYRQRNFRLTLGSLTCPFIPCHKSFTNEKGLDLHMSKYHLEKWYFGQGELIDYNYACHKCYFTTTSSESLRYHILFIHPSPFHNILK
ncbi:hypothetical protein DSO57_1030249 [Entomophthora muscae]|uniref:Uncharacterized protein n=1 Tax=Entomophthora muscae TaxID=34485 RepID=A0ACC2UAF4_9FUNG|nr:hypothetical protein DSO57_1030249 [Entomophthora muscae]